jgi:hypothetical protein
VIFVETLLFMRLRARYLTDESFRGLQHALLLRPDQGDRLQDGRGLRKLRWGGSGRGKRGGVRLIYFWAPERAACLLIYLWPKNVQDDLTRDQLHRLAHVAREEFS